MDNNSLLRLFGSNVARLRKARGLSQEKLAELTELDRTYISSIERGKRNVSLINICRIADALGCPPENLLSKHGEYDG
ncbi:helix-turn-helix transcriptional regulator [Vibrio sp. ABG19]|uniref:helix-turn-helix domain-containing protein n=1 Tax=Vibrio sp. ABG19 TaxID=2817385 RepID=UPI00249E531F|nr:helix-turn-helix transcriptional regulator [Vibrio sp. ABG19]